MHGFQRQSCSTVQESRLVHEFNLRQVGINHVSEVREDSTEIDSVYLEVDLLQLEGMKGALSLEESGRRAGIDKAYRVFAWASPPCETMSYLALGQLE